MHGSTPFGGGPVAGTAGGHGPASAWRPAGRSDVDVFAPMAYVDPLSPGPMPSGLTGTFEASSMQGPRRPITAWVVGMAVALLGCAGAFAAWQWASAPPPSLEIISSPPGAEVSVDGRVLPGTTPLPITEGLQEGRPCHVEVRLAGHQLWAADLTPRGGRLRQLVVLAPLPATLQVETVPPGVPVMINGVARGPSPVSLGGLVVGQQVTVHALAPGQAPMVRQVRLAEGTTVERIVLRGP